MRDGRGSTRAASEEMVLKTDALGPDLWSADGRFVLYETIISDLQDLEPAGPRPAIDRKVGIEGEHARLVIQLRAANQTRIGE